MYESSVPVLVRALSNLKHILEIGQSHAADKKIDESIFTAARLFPDMLPLTKQVQIACDVAKGCGGRLAGIELPKYEDNEISFDELKARVEKTIKFLQEISPESINGQEEKSITIKAGPNELTFVGTQFLNEWVMPNVYFHITTTYNLLRKSGVAVGKRDFLG